MEKLLLQLDVLKRADAEWTFFFENRRAFFFEFGERVTNFNLYSWKCMHHKFVYVKSPTKHITSSKYWNLSIHLQHVHEPLLVNHLPKVLFWGFSYEWCFSSILCEGENCDGNDIRFQSFQATEITEKNVVYRCWTFKTFFLAI